jgi:hypothetical protein
LALDIQDLRARAYSGYAINQIVGKVSIKRSCEAGSGEEQAISDFKLELMM